ncbi:hypothetical protein ACFXKR_16250 [Streptomyces violascens]|uniref:hypothetical protein n=1 Tax=Streptomyces violascens TaxID=67381 RepID=UPI0036C7B9FE
MALPDHRELIGTSYSIRDLVLDRAPGRGHHDVCGSDRRVFVAAIGARDTSDQRTAVDLGSYIGVPRVRDDEPTECGFSHWTVPVKWPGVLCDALQVAAIIFVGQAKLAEGADG